MRVDNEDDKGVFSSALSGLGSAASGWYEELRPTTVPVQTPKYKDEPSGGIGAFTPDSFPVFDVFCENCYVIADSNHGYKMLGVGKLVAEEVAGTSSTLLEPFRFSRYEQGKLHPVTNSPFPWS